MAGICFSIALQWMALVVVLFTRRCMEIRINAAKVSLCVSRSLSPLDLHVCTHCKCTHSSDIFEILLHLSGLQLEDVKFNDKKRNVFVVVVVAVFV